MKKELKGKNTIGLKIPMFILVIGYLIYFIYTFITKDYNFDDNFNKINLVLIFVSVFLLGCSAITTSKITFIYTLANYIIVFILISTSIYSVLPTKDKKANEKKEEIVICEGKTESSDNTKIEVTHTNDKVNKIIYTYVFDLKNKTGAENLVNRFDKSYLDFTNIYSEIEINDKVTVNLYYNLDNVSMDVINNIDSEITDSYSKLKENTLKNLTCTIKE